MASYSNSASASPGKSKSLDFSVVDSSNDSYNNNEYGLKYSPYVENKEYLIFTGNAIPRPYHHTSNSSSSSGNAIPSPYHYKSNSNSSVSQSQIDFSNSMNNDSHVNEVQNTVSSDVTIKFQSPSSSSSQNTTVTYSSFDAALLDISNEASNDYFNSQTQYLFYNYLCSELQSDLNEKELSTNDISENIYEDIPYHSANNTIYDTNSSRLDTFDPDPDHINHLPSPDLHDFQGSSNEPASSVHTSVPASRSSSLGKKLQINSSEGIDVVKAVIERLNKKNGESLDNSKKKIKKKLRSRSSASVSALSNASSESSLGSIILSKQKKTFFVKAKERLAASFHRMDNKPHSMDELEREKSSAKKKKMKKKTKYKMDKASASTGTEPPVGLQRKTSQWKKLLNQVESFKRDSQLSRSDGEKNKLSTHKGKKFSFKSVYSKISDHRYTDDQGVTLREDNESKHPNKPKSSPLNKSPKNAKLKRAETLPYNEMHHLKTVSGLSGDIKSNDKPPSSPAKTTLKLPVLKRGKTLPSNGIMYNKMNDGTPDSKKVCSEQQKISDTPSRPSTLDLNLKINSSSLKHNTKSGIDDIVTESRADGDRAEDAIKNNHSSNDENWIKEVCDNLANIGDNVYSPVLTPQYFDPSSSGTVGGVEEGPNIVQLVSILKLYGDKHNDEVKSHVGSLVGSTSYNSFKATLNEAIESDPNWKSIALTFQLGLLAIKSVSGCTESAKNIFKNTICYIEDTYSKWVKDQGGWESVAEDASSEVD